MHKRILALLLACLAVPAALADEGMWPFSAVPTAKIKSKYGFEITQSWLDNLRLSSVQMGDSAAFVSPDGLILTNHHVARRCIQRLSTAEQDYMKLGFYARTRDDEKRCPELEISTVQGIEDVSKIVSAAERPGMSPAQMSTAQRAVIARLETECAAATKLKCQVVQAYLGAAHYLFKYKTYKDVRLVFAPEFDIAFFGGDTENYAFPRYDFDIAVLRAYENGRPVHPNAYLRWSKEGANDGDLVFAAGYPAKTARMSTVAQMQFMRDVIYPEQIKELSRRANLLKSFHPSSAESARRIQGMIYSVENTLKAIQGYQTGLLDEAVMAKKAAEEQAVRKAIASDPRRRALIGDPWGEIEAAAARERQLRQKPRLSHNAGLAGRIAGMGRDLLQLAGETSKPNSQRSLRFRDNNLKQLANYILDPRPIDRDMEELDLAGSLAALLDDLGPQHSLVKLALAGESPQKRAHQLIAETKLFDLATRKALYEGGEKAIKASSDPYLFLIQQFDAEARLIPRARRSMTSPVLNQYTTIGKALFSAYGTEKAPDADGSLRFTYGAVRGSDQGGRLASAYTTIGQAFDCADDKRNTPPYQLPESWRNARKSLDLHMPFNFISTLDVIGGSSGSPVVNRDGDLVGVAFDANLGQLAGQFLYNENAGRTISLTSQAIIEVLRKVYRADALADELLGPTSAVPANHRIGTEN